MIRSAMVFFMGSFCWPRTSGDDPRGFVRKKDAVELAPHERG